MLRPNVGQKEPPRLGSTICYCQELARKSHQDSAVRFVTAKSWPERATKTRQYDLLRPNVGQKEPNKESDLLRPNVGQKEPPRLGSTICYGQDVWPERATKTRQYDLLRPNVGQKEPPILGNTICYGQELARKSHRDSAIRFVTAKTWPERAAKTRQYDLLRPSTAKTWPERAAKTRQYDLLRPRRCPERATKTRQYDLLRPRVGQKEPPRLGSTICYGQELARKSHRDSAVRFVTAKSWPEGATRTRQYDLLRSKVGQKEPPRLGSTICYGQTWARKSHQDSLARKSHQDSAVRFVTTKSWPERATKTRQYDMLRPNVGQKEPLLWPNVGQKEPPRLGIAFCYGQEFGQKESPRLGSTICYGQELARKSHQDSAVRCVTAKSCLERATKTRQYDLLRPRVGQKEPPRLGSTICYGQELARKSHQDSRTSHQDSGVRFVTAKSWPERATKTRQYDLLLPRIGQKEQPRLGSTICYGQELARKSHQDSAVGFVTAKRGPGRATETRQYDLLRPNVGQKEPPRLGSTICYGQELARKSHQDSAVRFVTAKSWPEGATKTRQYDLLRPRVGQKEPPRLGSTICYGQTWARKSHQDSAVRFVTAKSRPERATKTRQYDLLRPRVGQKEPPRLGSTICDGQELARKSHQDSAVRFVAAKRGPERAHQDSDLLRPNVGQKEPPRLGSTICYGQELSRKSHQDSAVRFVTAKSWPERATETRHTICYGQTWARKSHRDSAVRFVTAKRGPERATETRQYDLLRPRVARKSHRDSAVLFVTAKTLARKSHQDSAVRFVAAKCVPERSHQDSAVRFSYGQELARKSHQDSAVRFVTAKTLARKSHRDSAIRLVTAKRGPERATETRQYNLLRSRRRPERATETGEYDLLRPNMGHKEPPRLGSTICYGQELARKSHQDSAVRFVTAKSWPEGATKTRQYDLLRPRVGQKEPPRLGSTICYGQELARKSRRDSAVRFVTTKRGPERAFVTAKRGPERATETRQCFLLRPRVWPERATKTRQYDLLRPNVGQKEPPRLGSTICHGQELARKSHRDSAVRFVTAKSRPERATKTRQYDLLRPNVGQKEPPRLGSTICYGQTCHRDSAARFVRQELARKSHQDSDLLRPRIGQQEPLRLGSAICYGQEFGKKEPPRLGSTICYGQTYTRKSYQDSAVRFVTAKSWPERATKTRQYDLLRPRVGQKEPPRLGSTICYGQELARKSHQDPAVRFVTAKRGPERATKTRQHDLLRPRIGQKEPPRLGSTICYGQELARRSHQDSAVRFVTAKSWPERATKTRQYDLLRPRVGRKSHLGSTICYGQTWARKSHQDSAVRYVTAKRGPERATKTRQYDLLRPRVVQKEPPRLGITICYGQTWARKSHRDSAVRFVTAKRGPERATETRQYDLLRPRVARKSHRDSAVLFVTAKRGPERATKIQQYDLLRPNVCQKKPPKTGSTICYGQELARKSHQDSAVRFVTAKSWPERATKTRQYDLFRPNVGQKEPPRLGSTICYGQELARKSHRDSAVRFVTAKRGPERATKTRQYDLLRPRVGQKESPRLGSTICYGQTWARKSHQDSAVRFVTAKRWPERATKTRQYDLLRPRVGQKEPPRLGSTICYGQELARKSRRDSAVRFVITKRGPERAFVTAKRGPERATETRQCFLLRPRVWPERVTKTRQYDLLRSRVGQKEPPRLGSTMCYGQELSRKSHQDSAVRFVTAKIWPERATKTRQYDLLWPRVGQKEPPRLGSTICYGQTWARKSHQDSAVRFVTAKRGPERVTKTREYDLLRPNVGQKEPPRLGSTICYGQEVARKSHQDSAVRFVTAKSWPERATKTRQYDLLRPRVGQKEPPRLGSTICYGQELARKSHQDSAVRFVTAKSGPEKSTKTRQYDLLRLRPTEKATETRQYDLLLPRVCQKEPPRLGSTICYGQELARKSHQDSDLLRPNVGQKEPPRLGSTICYGQEFGQKEPPRLASTICYGQELARRSHQDSAVRFVTAKSWPERATKTRQYDLLRPRLWPERAAKTRQYDLLRPNVGQKEPPRLGSTICYGQELARKSHQDSTVRFVTAKSWPERATSTICYGQEFARRSHQDSAVRFVTAKSWPERATKTRQYDLLRPNVGQKEPPRLGSTICYDQTWARKSHQDSAVRFVTAKSWPERATKTRQYDLLRPRVVQKEPPRLGSTICYSQTWARKSHQDSAVRFVMAKRGPERATKTRQYDLLRPNVGQKEPPRLGSTICYGQELARKSHQDSAVRFVTAKTWARKNHQDSAVRFSTANRKSHRDPAVRFVTAKRGPERATKTRQYDLLRPRVGQKEPPRLGSTICCGQELARNCHQDSVVRFVTAKRGPERATETRQYDLLRPNVGQKEPPRLGSTICYGQELARKCHQDSAVRLVTAKRGPERATKTRQYDLLRPRVGHKKPPRLGSTICYGQTWARKSHQGSAVLFVTAKSWPERATETRQYDLLRPRVGQKEPPRLASTFCYGQTWARKSHQDSAVRFVKAKSGPEKTTKTRQYDLLRPRVGQKEPPRLGSTICYGQTWARKSHQDSAVRFVTAKTWARKNHQDSAVRFVTAKSWPEGATKTRQYDL